MSTENSQSNKGGTVRRKQTDAELRAKRAARSRKYAAEAKQARLDKATANLAEGEEAEDKQFNYSQLRPLWQEARKETDAERELLRLDGQSVTFERLLEFFIRAETRAVGERESFIELVQLQREADARFNALASEHTRLLDLYAENYQRVIRLETQIGKLQKRCDYHFAAEREHVMHFKGGGRKSTPQPESEESPT